MKMEKFEVKQEYKNQEGDPQIKGKRREFARELAYGGGPGATVKYAKFLVTNPIHIAVAIGYERDEDPAPYVLEMGEDKFAELMIKEAEKYNIPVMRNIPLARTLYEEGEVWAFVPRSTYEALAEILRWVESLDREQEPVET
jgi:flagellar biosynthesis protein FlhB